MFETLIFFIHLFQPVDFADIRLLCAFFPAIKRGLGNLVFSGGFFF